MRGARDPWGIFTAPAVIRMILALILLGCVVAGLVQTFRRPRKPDKPDPEL